MLRKGVGRAPLEEAERANRCSASAHWYNEHAEIADRRGEGRLVLVEVFADAFAKHSEEFLVRDARDEHRLARLDDLCGESERRGAWRQMALLAAAGDS